MSLSVYQRDYAFCLDRARQELGGPVRALVLEWDLEQLLRKRVRSVARQGLFADGPLVAWCAGRPRRALAVGIEVFQLKTPTRVIRLAYVVLPYCRGGCIPRDFWSVLETDHAALSSFFQRLARRAAAASPPLMYEADRQRLWQNTIGFLLKGRDAFRRFRIPKKRGVLLLGSPGNGKTMACRWLFSQCRQRGLSWRSVTVSEYQEARDDHTLARLFHLDRPGIVLFDDLDLGIRNREATGASIDHSAFLAELDGVATRRGVVSLFASNASLRDLDPAFRRPGRIDLVLEFAPPSVDLRARLIRERWQEEIQVCANIDEVVATTDGLSFAELEELRKLLVFNFLERYAWDWPLAWETFQKGRGHAASGRRIGFGLDSLKSASGVVGRTDADRKDAQRAVVEPAVAQ